MGNLLSKYLKKEVINMCGEFADSQPFPKVYLSTCPMCGSSDSEIIINEYPSEDICKKTQKILICKNCGLVYKNPVISKAMYSYYPKTNWVGDDYFYQRAANLENNFKDFYKDKKKPSVIVEIGPGHGFFSKILKKIFPEAKLILIETSYSCAEDLNQKIEGAFVVPESIENIRHFDFDVDLYFISGVDYLFPNIRDCFNKIFETMSDNAHMYIERNVFTTNSGYVSFAINTKNDMFFQNELMTTWFYPEQYEAFLSLYFDVCEKTQSEYKVSEAKTGFSKGYFCKKTKNITKPSFYKGKSWYTENKAILDKLPLVPLYDLYANREA